jgi:GTP-binding protein
MTANQNGQTVFAKNPDGKLHTGKITNFLHLKVLHKKETPEAIGGDIVMIAGIPEIYIGDTFLKRNSRALPAIKVDEPTISLTFLVNDSPFAGKEGKFVTGRQIRERLEKNWK